MRTRIVAVAAILIAALAAALLRFYVVEPEAIAHFCGAPGAPWWCALRAAVVAAFGTSALAIGALVVAGIAIVVRRSGAAIAAACLGVSGLMLYSVEAGAIAFLLGLIALTRPRDRQPGARGEQQA
jgi:hypothetical protein